MSVTICSVFPIKQEQRRGTFTPNSSYVMDAAKDGEVKTLVVTDQKTGRYIGADVSVPVAVEAIEVAVDLVSHFRDQWVIRGLPPTAGPGIWIPADKETPTPEEIAKAYAGQKEFAAGIIKQAEHFFVKQQLYNITDVHHEMAKVLGIEGRDWQQGQSRAKTKLCIWCQKPIPESAAKCGYCNEIVDRARYDALVAQTAPQPVPAPHDPPVVDTVNAPLAMPEVEEEEVVDFDLSLPESPVVEEAKRITKPARLKRGK